MNDKSTNQSCASTSNDKSAFKVPTDLELWSVLQKLMAFEEPASKRSHLRKALKKQAFKPVSQTHAVNSWSFDQQAVWFRQTFGDRSQACFRSNQIINALLFFEDLRRYNQIAFDTWWKSEGISQDTDAQSPGVVSRFEHPLITVDSEAILLPGDVMLSATEKRWLRYSMSAVPDWQLVLREGPWQNDARVQVICSLLSKVSSHDDFASVRPLWSKCIEEHRTDLPGDFLPEIILLVEGQTEALLIPTFARILKGNFNSLAVDVESCGGAQQVVRHYLSLKELTCLPIVCVLDSDVSEQAEIIEDSLRSGDYLLTMAKGEIEDTFSDSTFFRFLDLYLRRKGYLEPIAYADLIRTAPARSEPPLTAVNARAGNADARSGKDSRTGVLDKIFKSRGWGGFDKIGFAKLVAEHLSKNDIPSDGKQIIDTLVRIHDAGVKLRFQ